MLAFAVVAVSCGGSPDVEIQDGDIIFQRSQTEQAGAIQAATHSRYTHMGIIFIEGGKPVVYEAVQPVKKTPIQEWINRGKGNHYVIKRLRKTKGVDFKKVKVETSRMLGKSYDWLFGWSDQRIYCSELVWKAYHRAEGIEIGKLRRLGEFDLKNKRVKRIIAERYGQKIPLDMKVISPADMFNSKHLMTVEKS